MGAVEEMELASSETDGRKPDSGVVSGPGLWITPTLKKE